MITYSIETRGGVTKFTWSTHLLGAEADLQTLFETHFANTLNSTKTQHKTPNFGNTELIITWTVPNYAITEDLRTEIAFLMLRYA